MEIKLYNSLTKSDEVFEPVNSDKVSMYSCGPTVYNYAHIGNMRAFLFADLLQRVVRIVGKYDLNWVMNITNIDDKTIRDSAVGSAEWRDEMGKQTADPKENLSMLTEFYRKSFIDDITKLGIESNHFFAMPKATDYIEQMQDLIIKIVANAYAYASEGSVYFNVAAWRKDHKYGRLHKIDFDNFRPGERTDSDQYEREDVSDFVLWKAKKDDEPFWEFEVDGQQCPGRPGWHIECSAMEHELLGLPFDIHTGGIDLKFPHHEDEIAQSHAGYGIDPTKYWCHNEFLEVEGAKMSKSKGNFFTLRDLTEKGIDPLNIRFSMLSSHYASTFNFTFDGIESGRKGRVRVQEYIYDLHAAADEDATPVDTEKLKKSVFSELGNNLHTPKALAHLFTFINKNQAAKVNTASHSDLLAFFTELNQIFNVWKIAERPEAINQIPAEITELAELRLQAKRDKNWAEADVLRNKITEAGYIIKDAKDSYEIEKV